jgi:hypothetical protein
MYYYVMKEFGSEGWRYLRYVEADDTARWEVHPACSYNGERARELAERFDAAMVEVS